MYDYMNLLVYMETTLSPEYDCIKCLNKYKGRDEKMQEMHLFKKGCAKFMREPVHMITLDSGIVFYFFKCPTNYKNYYYGSLFSLADNYSKGIMPYNLGVMEHPHKLVEMLNTIVNLKIEYSEKEEQRKQKANRRINQGRR